MMRFLSPLFILSLLCVGGWAGPTGAQRATFWEKMHAQYGKNPQVVYNDGLSILSTYPGFLLSNEVSYYTLVPPASPADLQLGFATTLNFNIAAARRPKVLVLADQSIEPQAILASFYRPLFLVSPTAEEFVANLAGLPVVPGASLDSVFDRIDAGELPTAASIEALKTKLTRLKNKRVVTALDIEFVGYVLSEMGRPLPADVTREQGEVSIFRNSRPSDLLAQHFSIVYDERKYVNNARTQFESNFTSARSTFAMLNMGLAVDEGRALAQMELTLAELRQRHERLSFLTPEGYAFIRGLFERGAVYYAKCDIQDPALWAAVAKFADDGQHTVTDVYLSNILSAKGVDSYTVFDSMRDGLSDHASTGFILYRAGHRPAQAFSAGPFRFAHSQPLFENTYSQPLRDPCVDIVGSFGW